MNKTPEPLEILRAAGWRMRSSRWFARPSNQHKEWLFCFQGTWRYYLSGNGSRPVGETLADAVDAMGLGEPRMIVEAVR